MAEPNFIRGNIGVIDVNQNTQPEEWRKQVFRTVPAGVAPLTALMNEMSTETTPSRKFHWWEERDSSQSGDVTDVFSNPDFSSAYASGGVDGSVLYLQIPEASIKQIIRGHTLTVYNDSTLEGVRCDVLNVTVEGANSYAAVRLLEADTGSDLAGADLSFWITGDAQPEFGGLPEPLTEEPTEYENVTQIFAEAIAASGTKLAEVERITPDFWTRQRRAGLLRIRKRMEKAALLGLYKVNSVDGKQVRHTRGLYDYLETYGDNVIYNYKTDTHAGVSGKSWLAGAWDWFMYGLEKSYRYTTSGRKFALIGHSAMQSIQDMIMDMGYMKLETRQTNVGITINTLTTIFGPVNLVTAPLFTQHPAWMRSMVVFEPELMRMRPLAGRDLKFLPDVSVDKAGFESVDGKKEGWRAELGFEFVNPDAFCIFKNIGVANTAA